MQDTEQQPFVYRRQEQEQKRDTRINYLIAIAIINFLMLIVTIAVVAGLYSKIHQLRGYTAGLYRLVYKILNRIDS